MTQRKNLVAIGDNDASDQSDDVQELTGEGEAPAQPEDGHSPELSDDQGDDMAPDDEWLGEEEEPARKSNVWISPTLAIITILGWTGFFGWANQSDILGGGTPSQWIGWISQWSIPVLLILAIWLLALRNSTREAGRFAEAAQALSTQSAELETRLVTVNRELSLAREFLASQSRELESLGRVAAERLSTNADQLQSLIHDNSEQVRVIGEVSTNAVENMDNLRDQLPVLSNAARDLASQIGNAGHMAHENLDNLVGGFDRLNQFGESGTRLVDSLQMRIAGTLNTLEKQVSGLDQMAEQRFTGLAERSEGFRVEMESKDLSALADMRRRGEEMHSEFAKHGEALADIESKALSDMRHGMDDLRSNGLAVAADLQDGHKLAASTWTSAIDDLEQRMEAAITRLTDLDQGAVENAKNRLSSTMAEADKIDGAIDKKLSSFDAEMERREEQQSARQRQMSDEFEERVANFDSQMVERQEEHLAHISGLAERGEALGARLSDLDVQMTAMSQTGGAASQLMEGFTDGFAEKLGDSRALLEASSTSIAELTDQSVRLLEIIRSSKDFSSDDLPQAISQAEERLSKFEFSATQLHKLVQDAEQKGIALAAHIEQSNVDGAASLEMLEVLESRYENLGGKSQELAEQANGELQTAITALEGVSGQMVETLRGSYTGIVSDVSDELRQGGRKIIADTLREASAEAIEEIHTTTQRASETGRETIAELRDQLGRVNELAGNLEQRITRSREKAEEQVDNDFSRRMALITDSLNSSAIDISKVFDNDVSDTSWASYLRGDRGIFTRRAVRLLDGHESKSIAEVYDEDPDFRETVNRYIHDFEAMLRHILSTRDGNAIAVTMLSSDIGKLYVALAQAIDRLRD